MLIKKLVFDKCDHEGDLEAFELEVANSGGNVVGKQFIGAKRVGVIEIKVGNDTEWKWFLSRFEQTSSHHFIRGKK